MAARDTLDVAVVVRIYILLLSIRLNLDISKHIAWRLKLRPHKARSSSSILGGSTKLFFNFMILGIYLIGVVISYIYVIYTAYKYKKEVLISDLVVGIFISAMSYLTLIVFMFINFMNSKYWNKRVF